MLPCNMFPDVTQQHEANPPLDVRQTYLLLYFFTQDNSTSLVAWPPVHSLRQSHSKVASCLQGSSRFIRYLRTKTEYARNVDSQARRLLNLNYYTPTPVIIHTCMPCHERDNFCWLCLVPAGFLTTQILQKTSFYEAFVMMVVKCEISLHCLHGEVEKTLYFFLPSFSTHLLSSRKPYFPHQKKGLIKYIFCRNRAAQTKTQTLSSKEFQIYIWLQLYSISIFFLLNIFIYHKLLLFIFF